MQDRMQVVVFTNRKSHTGFPLVPKCVTLNDLESLNDVMAVILCYFTEFGSFGAMVA